MLVSLRWGRLCPPVQSLHHIRSVSSSARIIKEQDRVVLRSKNETAVPIITKPLRPRRAAETPWGKVKHVDLIGKKTRDVVETDKGVELRAMLPTLEEYVLLTPRIVTPVYPRDASTIVSLLDIHVSPRNEENEFQPPTEVLEAGTGHGALTLYLARAIHAANPPLPTEPVPKLFPTREQQAVWEAELNPTTDQVSAPVTNKAPPSQEDLHRRQAVIELGIEWKKRRGAIVHTIDNIPLHSLHAEKIVQSFGRGMYSGDVDFYTGNVGDWIVQQQKERFGESEHTSDKAFLTHIVLDLPGTHLYVERASSALTVDGNLLVFNPNVTQLVDCVKIIREKKLPLVLDRVVELGPGMSGGREWEIRSVLPRAAVKAQRERNGPDAIEPLEESTEIAGDVPQESPIADSSQSSAVGERDDSWQVICRPKFGARVVVGGFVGVWRKMSYRL